MSKDFGRLNNGDGLGLLYLGAIHFYKATTIAGSVAPAEWLNLQS